MPQLGIEASSPASSSRIPREALSDGIKNATPLMKRNELAVARSETIMIDQRAPAPISGVAAESVCIPHACIPPANFVVGLLSLLVIAWLVLGQARPATPGYAALATVTRWDRLAPPRAVPARIVARLGSSECALVESPARTVSPSSVSKANSTTQPR